MAPKLHPIWMPWLMGRRRGWGRQGYLCIHGKNQSCQQVSLIALDGGGSVTWRSRLPWPDAGGWCRHHLEGQLRGALEAEVLQLLLFLCKLVVLSFCYPWTCLGNGIWESEGWTFPNQIPLILCQQIWTFQATWRICTFSRSHVQGCRDGTVPIALNCNYCHALQQYIGEYMATNLYNKNFYTHGNDQFPQ